MESNGRFYLQAVRSEPLYSSMEVHQPVCQATCTIDPGGTILTWDEETEKLFEYTPAEVVGLHFYHLCDPLQMFDGSFERILGIAYREGAAECRCRCLHANGDQFGATIHLKPMWEGTEFRGYTVSISRAFGA